MPPQRKTAGKTFRVRVPCAAGGAESANVTVFTEGGTPVVSVRPLRSRRCFKLTLSQVARLIAEHPETEVES